MAVYRLQREQILPSDLGAVWKFISDPWNLPKITPDYMGFEITSRDLPTRIYPGLIISYKVSPLLGLKMSWVTEITHVKELEYFVDEQRIGPYSMWHHEHHIEVTDEGVLMKDIVTYRPPFGFVGSVVNSLLIRRKLEAIFDYRKIVLEKTFGNS